MKIANNFFLLRSGNNNQPNNFSLADLNECLLSQIVFWEGSISEQDERERGWGLK